MLPTLQYRVVIYVVLYPLIELYLGEPKMKRWALFALTALALAFYAYNNKSTPEEVEPFAQPTKKAPNNQPRKNGRFNIKSVTAPIAINRTHLKKSALSPTCQEALSVLSKDLLDFDASETILNTLDNCVGSKFKKLAKDSSFHRDACNKMDDHEFMKLYCLEYMLAARGSLLSKIREINGETNNIKDVTDQELVALYLSDRLSHMSYSKPEVERWAKYYEELMTRFPESRAVNQEVLHATHMFMPESDLYKNSYEYHQEYFPNDSGLLNIQYYETTDFNERQQIFDSITQMQPSSSTIYKSHATTIWQESGQEAAVAFINEQIDTISSQWLRRDLETFLNDIASGKAKYNTSYLSSSASRSLVGTLLDEERD